MKSKLLYIASFLVLVSLSFTFDESHITWIWNYHIQVPIILLSISAILVVTHLYQKKEDYII